MKEWAMKTKEIIKYIRLYNPYCEHLTLCTIFAKMHLVKFNIVNFGPPGCGKSESSLELVNKLNLGKDIILDNTTTERGLFELFREYPEQDLILDECNAILRNPSVQDMIKLAMESKPLIWTKNNSKEETPPYKGNIILNTNVPVMDSIIDRCYLNKAFMNKEMTLDFIDYFLAPKDIEKFISFLKKRISKIIVKELTNEEVKYVQEFTKKHVTESDKDLGYSRRCIFKMLNYFLCVKNLFEKLDDEVKEFIEPYARLYVINDETPALLEAIVGDGEIDKVELQRRMMKEGGYTERHARRLVTGAIKDGTLELKGRNVRRKK